MTAGLAAEHGGSAAELRLGYNSGEGLGQADIKLMMGYIAGGTRCSWNVRIE
jgi:hypothetical protein